MKDLIGKLTDLEATAPKAPAKKKNLTEDTTKRELAKKPTLKDVFNQLSETVAPGQKPLPVLDPTNKKAGMGFVTSNNPAVQNMLKNLDPKDVQIVQAPGQQGTSQQTTQGGQGQSMGATAQGGGAPANMQGNQAMQEDELDERDEGKPGKNFAKIAKSAAKRYGSKEAGERVAGAVRAKLAKQGKLEEADIEEGSQEKREDYLQKAFASRQRLRGAGKNNPNLAKKADTRDKYIHKALGKSVNGEVAEGAKVDRMVKHIEKSERKLGKSKEKASDIAWATANKRGMLDNKNKKKVKESARDEYQFPADIVKKVFKYKGKPFGEVGIDPEYDDREAWYMKCYPFNIDNSAYDSYEEAVAELKDCLDQYKAGARPEGNELGEADIPSTAGVDTKGAGLGAGRSATTLEGKGHKEVDCPSCEGDGVGRYGKGECSFCDGSGVIPARDLKNAKSTMSYLGKKKTTEGKKAKPDFLDFDKDGNKGEPMKKAINDKKKKTVKEGMSHRIAAARHEGRAHGLKGMPHCGKNYDDMEECKAYHMGYKDGLDECYGMGVYEAAPAMPAATVHGMADGAMDEGNAFTAALARTPKGGKFSVGGKTFTDRTSYDAPLDEYAFESWNKQLKNLINEGEVNEGISVSVSKGNHGAEDSVNINATGPESEELMAIVKSAGLGLFGDEAAHEPSQAMSIQPTHGEPEEIGSHGGDIEVVDGSDDMLSLMKKLGGVEASGHDEDYADEEGCGCDDEEETNEAMCNECGMYESECGCSHGKEQVEEVESEDQMEYEVAEDNAPDNGSANSTNATKGNDAANMALAVADKKGPVAEENEEDEEEDDLEESYTFESIYKKLAMLEGKECTKCHKSPCECEDEEDEEDEMEESKKLDEWANDAGPGKTVSDTTFEQDIDFMTKVIAGGLNKPKSTGQTTVPVIAGQEDRMHDSPKDWATLAGIKKA